MTHISAYCKRTYFFMIWRISFGLLIVFLRCKCPVLLESVSSSKNTERPGKCLEEAASRMGVFSQSALYASLILCLPPKRAWLAHKRRQKRGGGPSFPPGTFNFGTSANARGQHMKKGSDMGFRGDVASQEPKSCLGVFRNTTRPQFTLLSPSPCPPDRQFASPTISPCLPTTCFSSTGTAPTVAYTK